MKVVIVDDEPLAREGIANYVREVDFLQLVDTCENPVALTAILAQSEVDLVFLDIQMPKMSGIDLLKMIKDPPLVVITTAYPSYALEGFQLNVLDYLLKPITFERFFKAANKAWEYFKLKNASSHSSIAADEDHFFVKCGNKLEKIFFGDILYIEGMQNYVTIHTSKGKYITLLLLKSLEEKLDPKSFIRVHKSFIVAVNKIDGMEGNDIHIQATKIPMSRNYRQWVTNRVLQNKLWDKITLKNERQG